MNIKSISRLFMAVAGFFYSNNSFAQFETERISCGAGLGYTAFMFDDQMRNSVSLNLRANYTFNEKNHFVLGFTLQSPFTYGYQLTASSYSSMTSPSSIQVDVKEKVNPNYLYMEYQRYFIQDSEEPFGIYGLIGSGVIISTPKNVTVSNYDQTEYTLQYRDQGTFGAAVVHLGVGTNIILNDRFFLFGEVKSGIPVGTKTTSLVGETYGTPEDNPFPINFGIQTGVRYLIFEEEE